jgi:hypothetical protein
MVGQELNQALSVGCRVYHDVLFDGYNIDHVIVAPSGVYAVETKTRRKSRDKGSHKVKYDGHKLIFPEWEDEHGLEQARRNAKSLSLWLNKAVAQSLWVEPILTLPGWLIDREAGGAVTVLNPKEIVNFVTRDRKPILLPELIQRISFQLEQKNARALRSRRLRSEALGGNCQVTPDLSRLTPQARPVAPAQGILVNQMLYD